MNQDVMGTWPIAILDRELVQRRGRAATSVLVQWNNGGPEDATLKFLYDLQLRYPDFAG